jgi:hypothetical protein
MKCRVGDLAVVIRADIRSNLGRIVKVLGPHDGCGLLRFKRDGMVWKVACHQPMTWSLNGKLYRRKIGPVPDNRLQPIRGVAPESRERMVARVVSHVP